MESPELDLQLLLFGAALGLGCRLVRILNHTSRGHHLLVEPSIHRSLQIKWAFFLLVWRSSFGTFGWFWWTILNFRSGYWCSYLGTEHELGHTVVPIHDAFLRQRDWLLGGQRHSGIFSGFLITRTNVVAHIYETRKDFYLFKTNYLIFLLYSLEAK